MTDRVKGFMVALDQDIRVDDVEAIVNAIRMIKHVAGVEPVISQPDHWFAMQRVEHNVKMRLFDAINAAFEPEKKG